MTDPIEIMARAYVPMMLEGTYDYEGVPPEHVWSRPRYQHLREMALRHTRQLVGAMAEAGYAIVPVTPTEAMRNAGADIGEWADNLPPQTMPWAAADVFRAMIEAGRVKA